MGCLAHLDGFAGEGRAGIDEVGHIERRTAGLTLVAVGIFIVAAGACADNITVGKEFAGFFIVRLESCLDRELAFIIEVTEEFRGSLVVKFGCGA